jgi:hypothetical protein
VFNNTSATTDLAELCVQRNKTFII